MFYDMFCPSPFVMAGH
ncbi:hypothetical protein F383_13867 [Gossypium arboreum]|uniref:Uncharacterized protein n=1 Tax=Gossypium arboreum TaxID=29729 RepID=A0A0B0NF47_GOSAR|nr:hypothetical protein F383_13867 [Gossypium arboreum]